MILWVALALVATEVHVEATTTASRRSLTDASPCVELTAVEGPKGASVFQRVCAAGDGFVEDRGVFVAKKSLSYVRRPVLFEQLVHDGAMTCGDYGPPPPAKIDDVKPARVRSCLAEILRGGDEDDPIFRSRLAKDTVTFSTSADLVAFRVHGDPVPTPSFGYQDQSYSVVRSTSSLSGNDEADAPLDALRFARVVKATPDALVFTSYNACWCTPETLAAIAECPPSPEETDAPLGPGVGRGFFKRREILVDVVKAKLLKVLDTYEWTEHGEKKLKRGLVCP